MGQTTGVRFETVFLSKNPPDEDRVNELIYWSRRFDELGLAPKSAGNLSFRTENGFIITATGVALKAAERENLVEVLKVETGKEQIVVHVRGKEVPSKESILHSEVYGLRPEINAVFHIHDLSVVELADDLKILCTEGEQPRGSYELVTEVNRLLCFTLDVNYIVLRNHGIISIGETMEKAGKLAEDMNRAAQNVAQKRGVENEGNTGI